MIFLDWVGEKEDPGDTEKKGVGVLLDGLYEIEQKQTNQEIGILGIWK